ncbi:hypothetical protein C8Q74DRAFT_499201 [Fomes fomentarius]|nr:hypothetical protein C8Q74DRAFT_499201 [Fomes fomentarius]
MSITFFAAGCFLGFGAYGIKKAQELAREREATKPTDSTAFTTSTPDTSVSPPIQSTLEVTEDLTANCIPPAETPAPPAKGQSRIHTDTALTSSPADSSPSPPTQATSEVTEDLTASSVPPAEAPAPPAKERRIHASIACPKVDVTRALTSTTRRGSLSKLTSHVPTLRNLIATHKNKQRAKSVLASIPIIAVPESDVLTGAVGDVFVPTKPCPGEEDAPVPEPPLTASTSTSTSTSSRGGPQPAKRSVCMNSKVRVRTFKSTLPPSSVSSPPESSSCQTSSQVPTPSAGSSPDTSSHQPQSSVKPPTPRPILKTRAAGRHGKGHRFPAPSAHIHWARDAERVPAALKRQASALGASRVRRALSSSRSL